MLRLTFKSCKVHHAPQFRVQVLVSGIGFSSNTVLILRRTAHIVILIETLLESLIDPFKEP